MECKCSGIAKPEFTEQQIIQCHKCGWISDRKIFCGRFGVRVGQTGTIITPPARPILPAKTAMVKNFTRASIDYARAGFQNRTGVEQKKCLEICESNQCGSYIAESKLGPRCSRCGCRIKLATLWATKHCPAGLW